MNATSNLESREAFPDPAANLYQWALGIAALALVAFQCGHRHAGRGGHRTRRRDQLGHGDGGDNGAGSRYGFTWKLRSPGRDGVGTEPWLLRMLPLNPAVYGLGRSDPLLFHQPSPFSTISHREGVHAVCS